VIYVPDTSVIVDGRFTAFIGGKEDSHVIIPEALVAEVEHQANEGRSIGFAALQDLKALRELADTGAIRLEFYGRRPAEWQIEKAKSGEIDELIRQTALENDGTLVTGDAVQSQVALIKGIRVEFLEPLIKQVREIEEFFDQFTTSVHLKSGMRPMVKRGAPGSQKLERLDMELSEHDMENLSTNLVKRGRQEGDSFIEMDMYGATVVQLRDIRIVITRPPFSDDFEITAVRPIKKLSLEEYSLDVKLVERLEHAAFGILVAGAPGAGKSTFVQALAERLSDLGNIVKTMENPRDLQVNRSITQYTALENSMEKTGDILLLVRTDYTIFDEMRVTSDFEVYADLRLSGVGMVGVVHATKPVDAIQRFVGRIELGLIPQVVDTIVHIDKGRVAKVMTTENVVRVPTGMTQEDLARPVIVVRDFFSGQELYEIYTFGEQVVMMPISPSGGSHPANDLAALRIEDEIRKFTGIREVKASVVGESKAIVRVPEDHIARLIGKKGSMISEIESRLGIGIEVEPMSPSSENLEMVPAVIEVKNRIIYVDVGVPGVLARIYVEGIPVLAAKTSNKGTLRIRMENEAGAAIFNAVKSGKSVLVSAERSPA
jgi:ATPase